ncbi:alpha/beta fold hydrolase [Amycolatopsis sp. GM8]|uniref:alpha/beta fold hydrolase n=1 Tax=Amycolatopsis sp. GM8 TaxID=2896530 RepID=UPI001F1BA46D|nr:alpha/beta hydrolase [Amycolatopsis sp. GM8]
MSLAIVDGISTRYEVDGSGPPLLMCSPGGFNAKLENWRTHGIYRRTNLLAHLAERFTCIRFDRREAGSSGGRLERVTWADYARQALGLLDHLGIERANLIGGCVGCSVVAQFAVSYPGRVSRMVLFSPAGGVKYRMTQHDRFARHLAFVRENGLQGVIELALSGDSDFSKDPRVGPWVTVIRTDPEFAKAYADGDAERYRVLVTGMARTLFDRDTVPGPEPEDLLRLDIPALIVPGEDTSHAPSAARYLQECLPLAEYWDVPVAAQTETTAPAKVLEFLGG